MRGDFAVFLIVVALICLAIRLSRDWSFLTRPRMRALATVVDHDSVVNDGVRTPLLVLRFETDDGQPVYVRDSLGPPSHEIGVGSLVGVEYPAGYPSQAKLLQSRTSPLEYVVCLAGLAMGVASLINPKWIDLIRDRLFDGGR
jgi:hypothetical protein